MSSPEGMKLKTLSDLVMCVWHSGPMWWLPSKAQSLMSSDFPSSWFQMELKELTLTENSVSAWVQYRIRFIETKKQFGPKFKNTGKWRIVWKLNRKRFSWKKVAELSDVSMKIRILQLCSLPLSWTGIKSTATPIFLQLAFLIIKTMLLEAENKLEC